MPNKVQSKYQPEENLFCRTGCVKVGSQKINTPNKSFELSQSEIPFQADTNIFGFNEYKRIFPEETIKTSKGRNTRYSIKDLHFSKLGDQFRSQMRTIVRSQKGINCFFFGFRGNRFPDKSELTFLATESFSYSDIVPFPIIGGLSDLVSHNTIQNYYDFLSRAYQEYITLNNKPIMGIIPKSIPPGFYPDLVKFYIDKDITSFAFDFEGAYPGSAYQNVLYFFRALLENSITQESTESVIMAINPGPGRMSQKRTIVESRDIVSVEYGFDILGKPLAFGRKPKEPFSPGPRPAPENRLRLFHKYDYGYHNVLSSEFAEAFPQDSSIESGKVLVDNNYLNLLNMEQKGLEMLVLRVKIRENETKDHIGKKKYVTPHDISKIKKMRGDLTQTRFPT
jgi:hypothetical protein